MPIPITSTAAARAAAALASDPAEIPHTIRTAADVLRGTMQQLGRPSADWRYRPMDNWPHAGYISATGHPQGAVVADVHLASGAGPYMALMGPQTGRALADWLDSAANREERHQAEIPAHQRQMWGLAKTDEAFGALVIAHSILIQHVPDQPAHALAETSR